MKQTLRLGQLLKTGFLQEGPGLSTAHGRAHISTVLCVVVKWAACCAEGAALGKGKALEGEPAVPSGGAAAGLAAAACTHAEAGRERSRPNLAPGN